MSPFQTRMQSGDVALEWFRAEHLDELCALYAPDLFRHYTVCVQSTEDMRRLVGANLQHQERGFDASYVVRVAGVGLVGSTSLRQWEPANRRIEIGSTWYAPEWQRTRVNTHCKLMLLGQAFEQLGCASVWLQTDTRNLRSQQAIERLGARRDGLLRAHRVREDGSLRDSVIYSMLADEWPSVKASLQAKLAG